MKRKILSIGLFMLFSLSLFNPGAWAWGWRSGKVVSPEGEVKEIEWNEWELMKDPAKRDVAKSELASCHIIRIQNSEPLHTHETHELFAVVLKGSGKMHFHDNSYSIQKGDVVHVPPGVPHWVENNSTEAIEAYAIFTPPFDGKDFHPVSGRRPGNSRQSLYENG